MTDDDYHCPDCGAPLEVLYRRDDFDVPMVTGWCSRTGVSKAVPTRRACP